MSRHVYRPPGSRGENSRAVLLGAAVALGLFVLMALAQMIGDVAPPPTDVEETLLAYVPPEIEELEEEPPPIEEEDEPPPELEETPPQLSLDQLDIALNPGTGGALAGDFAMPVVQTSARDLGTEEFIDFSDLDQMPRPVGVSGFNFPRRLRKKKVNGKIILLVKLDETGEVLEVSLESSNLPDFDNFVVNEVRKWRFTPPTHQGRAVKAKARLPIPIRIQ